MARPAEHHHPGSRHVLDLRRELSLSPAQVARYDELRGYRGD